MKSSHRGEVALLTAGRDKPYALGMASALISQGLSFDFVGSDLVEGPELHGNSQVHFLNLRNQREGASVLQKMIRVIVYYMRLVYYAATAKPKVFHILWNNKFEVVDRTLLMFYYRLLGKKIVLTAHNVNAKERDGGDSWLNRFSLGVQYRSCDRLFVHTQKMKDELVSTYRVRAENVTVIPFGINNTVPNTAMTTTEARRRIGVDETDRTLLFYGNIAPYKGLEYLLSAFEELVCKSKKYRLIIAGRPKECPDYWSRIQKMISSSDSKKRMVQRIEHIPDEDTELYFKAADALVLPYTHIFQSGVLFLGYSFGVPVLAADVGSLKQEIVEGETGFVFPPENPASLVDTIEKYFASDLYQKLATRRLAIRDHANKRYSWTQVGVVTVKEYSDILNIDSSRKSSQDFKSAPKNYVP